MIESTDGQQSLLGDAQVIGDAIALRQDRTLNRFQRFDVLVQNAGSATSFHSLKPRLYRCDSRTSGNAGVVLHHQKTARRTSTRQLRPSRAHPAVRRGRDFAFRKLDQLEAELLYMLAEESL